MTPLAKRLQLLCTMLVLHAALACSQGTNYVGTSSANFLKIGLGAGLIGKAESDVTSAADASILYWNPGATSRIDRVSLSFSYLGWLVGSNMGYIAATVPFEIGTAGVDLAYFTSGDIEETTLAAQDGTGRVFTATDFAFGLSFARNITDRFSVGVKVKYIDESLSSVSASTFAFDIGSVFTTSFLNDLELGIALSNFGGSMQFSGNDLVVTQPVPGSPTNKVIPATLQTDSWNLPLLFRIGATTRAIRSEELTLALSAAVLDSRDHAARYHVGGECTLFEVLSLRGGYRFNNVVSTYSAGCGVRLKEESLGALSFDYAFTHFKDLNVVHQFSLSIGL